MRELRLLAFDWLHVAWFVLRKQAGWSFYGQQRIERDVAVENWLQIETPATANSPDAVLTGFTGISRTPRFNLMERGQSPIRTIL
jgi:hypothetical protein